MAMYITPGSNLPNALQDVVIARYEQCEDMACILSEQTQAIAFKENLSEKEVLERCHQGLLADAANFNEKEVSWVICRLAELLGWESPGFD